MEDWALLEDELSGAHVLFCPRHQLTGLKLRPYDFERKPQAPVIGVLQHQRARAEPAPYPVPQVAIDLHTGDDVLRDKKECGLQAIGFKNRRYEDRLVVAIADLTRDRIEGRREVIEAPTRVRVVPDLRAHHLVNLEDALKRILPDLLGSLRNGGKGRE